MSTITKFKGEIENPDLKVLTSSGLVNQTIGKYAVLLDEQGYALTSQQKDAVEKFINAMDEANITRRIMAMYPFIGTVTNKNAAKVPLFGDKLMDFSDSFSGWVFDEDTQQEIIGINKMESISSFKVKHVAPESGRFLGAGYSINKTQTPSGSDLIKLFCFGSAADDVQIRSMANRTIGFYGKKEEGHTSNSAFTINTDSYNTQKKYPGSLYLFAYSNNHTTDSPYFRTGLLAPSMSVDSIYTNSGYATGSNNCYWDFGSKMENSVIAQNYPSDIIALTSITFFKEYFTSNDMIKAYIRALREFMIDLGRHIEYTPE